ncbi:MAG: hypothetical protein EOP51_00375 [Sphingobacteriales bacterium]|nr:MAG: hypothetical protein EOP51_00375 [Sphingobacteriales bacterium]
MKRKILGAAIIALTTLTITGCSKKEDGVCYCKYLSGDKKEYNLKNLDDRKAQDSCNVLDGYAEAFAGDCSLK